MGLTKRTRPSSSRPPASTRASPTPTSRGIASRPTSTTSAASTPRARTSRRQDLLAHLPLALPERVDRQVGRAARGEQVPGQARLSALRRFLLVREREATVEREG